MLFDSHCHISEEAFDDCKEELIAEIEASEIKYLIDVGWNLESSLKVTDAAAKYSFCYGAVGVHPHDAKTMDEEVLKKIAELYGREKIVAIGEIGLDYHYDLSEREVQRYWFKRQLELAAKLRAPVIIHSREADADTMEILKDSGIFSQKRKDIFPVRPDGLGDARVLIHCFSGSAETARQYEKLGATVSFCGPLTFKNARKSVEAAEAVDISNILVETDSPYMAPVPLRGQKNKPQYVEFVARKLAEIKGLSYGEVSCITMENAMRFFGMEEKDE